MSIDNHPMPQVGRVVYGEEQAHKYSLELIARQDAMLQELEQQILKLGELVIKQAEMIVTLSEQRQEEDEPAVKRRAL